MSDILSENAQRTPVCSDTPDRLRVLEISPWALIYSCVIPGMPAG